MSAAIKDSAKPSDLKGARQVFRLRAQAGGVLTGRDYQQVPLYYLHKIVDGLLRYNDARRGRLTLFTTGAGQSLDALPAIA